MKRHDVRQLMSEGIFEDKPIKGELEETNISWVILTENHAFKIKKEIRLSFLDYSTLELRKECCQKELELNRRFSSIYLSILPITYDQGVWKIGEGAGKIMDYAVCMKRMESAKRLDTLLKHHDVDPDRIILLANQVAHFHQHAEVIKGAFNLEKAKELFSDLNSVQKVVLKEFGPAFSDTILKLISFSDDFLSRHAIRFEERIKEGLTKDVHGDLHCGNIFLYKTPVIFDCIEFQDAFRQIDVLYEIAFMCMDLEFFGRNDLSNLFLDAYKKIILASFQKDEDEAIFLYYKCLRANVRAKVFLLNSMTEPISEKKAQELTKGKKYLDLAMEYHRNLLENN
ncbi:hypothetical protein M3O96_06400 [Aquiflexum sp. TKW24L]|uniref:hypothetical protein n=1 Tax=Aquiflexum sp. TKW24L TaxID=2942212 RepID=UPI0020C0427B|nr:hypothetical protein [Aquiflexum sp. TKW24L]MCL6258709.1 hypothetical protein [Aquiflexum sp. TKW24L]